jgi:hypothetical protein
MQANPKINCNKYPFPAFLAINAQILNISPEKIEVISSPIKIPTPLEPDFDILKIA